MREFGKEFDRMGISLRLFGKKALDSAREILYIAKPLKRGFFFLMFFENSVHSHESIWLG